VFAADVVSDSAFVTMGYFGNPDLKYANSVTGVRA